MSDIVERQHQDEIDNADKVWLFRKIVRHVGPLSPNDPNYKGSKWNLRVEWEDGSITDEPLSMLIKDDPVSCAKYAKDNDLLEVDGWKRLKKIARRQKVLARMLKQSVYASKRHGPIFKFGVQVPRNSKEARELDRKNCNTKWTDAERLETNQLLEYETFIDKGKGGKPPDGYKWIKVLWVYDVKHNLRHKARCVAGGHLTDPSKDNAYCGVVSLRTMRLALLIGDRVSPKN